MANRVGTAEGITKREIPRIAGSSAAFIAIVVVLIVIIAVSCSAVVYLLRDDYSRNDPRARRQQYTQGSTPFGSMRHWFARTRGSSGPSQRAEPTRPNKTRSAAAPGEGWMHARSTSDWDLDASGGDTRHPHDPIAPPSMRITDRESAVSPRSSHSGSSPGSSGHYAPMRGHSSIGHSSFSHHGVTIESQLSSQLSSPPLRRVASQEAIVSTTDSYHHFSDHDSHENVSTTNPFAETTSQTISTFNSGSKFIEAL